MRKIYQYVYKIIAFQKQITDERGNEVYQDTVTLILYSSSVKEALEKAKLMYDAPFYKLFSVTEDIDTFAMNDSNIKEHLKLQEEMVDALNPKQPWEK